MRTLWETRGFSYGG